MSQNPPNERRIPTQQWLDAEIAKQGMNPEELAQIGNVEGERARTFMALNADVPFEHLELCLVEAFFDARDEEFLATKAFAKEVAAMLDLQQAYFKQRRPDALAASKVKEREIRDECQRILRRPNLGGTVE